MDASKTIGERFEMGRQMEKDSRLSDAAVIYQKLFDKDPTARPVIERLLIIYRKLKEYKNELAVLDAALAALQRRQKAIGEKWIQSHPQAAKVGKSMLRQLEKGDNSVTGLGADPLVERWSRRKALVSAKLSGKKQKRPRQQRQETASAITQAAARHKEDLTRQKKEERERKAAQAEDARQKAAAAASKKAAAAASKKAAAASKKAAAANKAAEARRPASLFVIILHYLVTLEEIDAAMKQHTAYLNKYYHQRVFLVSGRQVPRSGGVILARAKDRAAMDKIISQDPFVKRNLASADIIEFTASRVAKGLEGWQK